MLTYQGPCIWNPWTQNKKIKKNWVYISWPVAGFRIQNRVLSRAKKLLMDYIYFRRFLTRLFLADMVGGWWANKRRAEKGTQRHSFHPLIPVPSKQSPQGLLLLQHSSHDHSKGAPGYAHLRGQFRQSSLFYGPAISDPTHQLNPVTVVLGRISFTTHASHEWYLLAKHTPTSLIWTIPVN